MIKILTIDDNRDNLISLKALLSELLPQSVVYMELTGQGGIESARKNNPDVILLDIEMPGMDGYQVCKILKADEQLLETPIIFLTALTGDKQSRILALEAGGEAFLAKPIDISELKAQILAMLKIKKAAAYKRNEKLRLEVLVQKRTEELKGANIAALNLLEDLNTENEIRKQREEALRMSKELLSETESIGKVGGWSFNIDTMEQKWTDEVYRIHEVEISPGPSVDSGINYYTKESRPIIEKAVQRAIEHGENYDLELEIISAKGNTRAVHTIGKADLKNRRIYGFFQDITERKQAEEKLKLLNRAVEASSVSVVITDAEGNINYVNPYFIELTGYSYEEALGKNPRFLKSGNQPKTFYEELWKALLSGKDWTGEIQNKKKNGELYWERAVISPILNSNGKVVNFVAIKDDITERKKILEELIVAKEKAEQSDKLKTEFLAQMSHEIRTPMNAIMSFASILNEDLEEMITPDIKKYFDGIDSAGHRLIRTVDMILNSSELQIGTYEPIFTEFCLIGEIIRRIENDYSASIREKSLEYNFISNVNEAVVYGDKYTIYQLFVNLIDNAVKYTKQGSITVKVEENEQSIKASIEDTGIGISEGFMMTKMYEPFIQEDRGYSRRYEGNGLGLSLVKKYCELNGITIEAESKKGIGTKFTLIFTKKK